MCEFSVHKSQPEADLWVLGAGIRAENNRNRRGSEV